MPHDRAQGTGQRGQRRRWWQAFDVV